MATKIIEMTSTGLKAMNENEIFTRIVTEMQEIDPDINTDPSTFDMMMAAKHAERFREQN